MEEESKVKSLWKGLPLKYKLIAIGIGSGLIFIIIFIVILITPLMELGIIDISDIGSSGLSYSSNTYIQSVNNSCESGVIVEGTGVVPLEDYVAGVISGEAITSENMEALKAQAIAARTFVISMTNNCQNSIENSSRRQNYKSNYAERAIEAAQATTGLVLTYNSQIFTTMYDSYYKGGDYSCDSNGCTVTYIKLPNNETHVVSIPASRKNQAAGGHGKGMSQVASYAMADQGYTYDQILYYFYSDGVQISSLAGTSGYTSGLSASGDYAVRIGMPVQGNEHDNKYWFSNENISYASGYVGECTWYAYGRANEILDYAGSDLNWNYAPHAKYWLDYNINAGANAFSYSTDVTQPKEGAIIVWSSDQYGHVAVVEKVNDDGTIDYSEANISSVKSSSNPYGFRYQSHVSYTGTGTGTISSIWSGYSFVGYIYMIE